MVRNRMVKKGFIGAIVLAVILFGGVILGLMCTERIPAGYVGVVYNMNGGVDGVTRAISGLELVNQEIEDTKSEIDEYISRLTEQRDTLVHNQKRNCVVIKNFSKLLAVDEAEEESETAS